MRYGIKANRSSAGGESRVALRGWAWTLRLTAVPVVMLAAAPALPGAVGSAEAQEPAQVAGSPTCAEGQVAVGDLGISGLACRCTHYLDSEDPRRNRSEFRSEPTVLAVDPNGPAAGRLRKGDVIVAIDGRLITTREAGRRFARVEPGRPVRLTVRRDGREVDLTVIPEARCKALDPAPPGARETPPFPESVEPSEWAVPETEVAPFPAPEAEVAFPPEAAELPAPPLPAPSGWMGISVSCSACGVRRVERDGRSVALWDFASPPTVESVEGESPAYEAGVRGGDRITHIDGAEITSDEGGAKFGAIEPGQRVRLRIRRGGRTRVVVLTAGDRIAGLGTPEAELAAEPPEPPGEEASPAEPPAGVRAAVPGSSVVRFTGMIGDTFVQVSGGPVTVTEREAEVVIRGRDLTVRIRKTSGEQGQR